MNRYTYCLNNPLAYVDPTGHEEEQSGEGQSTDDPTENDASKGNQDKEESEETSTNNKDKGTGKDAKEKNDKKTKNDLQAKKMLEKKPTSLIKTLWNFTKKTALIQMVKNVMEIFNNQNTDHNSSSLSEPEANELAADIGTAVTLGYTDKDDKGLVGYGIDSISGLRGRQQSAIDMLDETGR